MKIVKSLLKKYKKGDYFNLSWLVYRSTPPEGGKSPAELFYGRKIRSNLPISSGLFTHSDCKKSVEKSVKQKKKQKLRYDRKVRKLPVLRNRVDSKCSGKGVVHSQVAPCSYIVESPDGVQYRRNRRDMLKTSENFIVPDPSLPIQEMDKTTYSS